MEIKDMLGPLVGLIGTVVTILIYSRNNHRERKKEFAELRAAMDKDKQTEIDKVKEDAEKTLKFQQRFDEQAHEISMLKNDVRVHKEAHEEVRSDLHEMKGIMNQILQKLALLEQSSKQRMKGLVE